VTGVDSFGRDEAVVAATSPWLEKLMQRWCRLDVVGMDRLPAGPAVLVCNHGGALPYDALALLHATAQAGRVVRPLVEDAVATAPFVGTMMARLGCVRASQDNADRLLSSGALVAVFPEGMQGLAKTVRRRYRLQRFGRGGFVRLALRNSVPLVPVCLVGGEDTSPLLSKIELFFRDNDRFPYLPLTPVLPLPAKWRVHVGEPIDVAARLKDTSDASVAELALAIRDDMQKDVLRLVDERGNPWW
jgi:1-acyl-sn-glycerol-3-phosphate acyltransferase